MLRNDWLFKNKTTKKKQTITKKTNPFFTGVVNISVTMWEIILCRYTITTQLQPDPDYVGFIVNKHHSSRLDRVIGTNVWLGFKIARNDNKNEL